MDLSDRLTQCYTSAVHDVLRELDHPNCVLPPGINPLVPGGKLAGPVWTVSGHLDYAADPHETLLQWTGVLSKAPSGTVVVCQPNNQDIALMGELSAEALRKRGVKGYVVDGGCRDADFLIDMGFPVYCRFLTPSDIVGRWLPDALGESVTIGTMTIKTGDWLLADRDGIVVIPQSLAERAVSRTEEVVTTESTMRKAILDGVDPQAAYLEHGIF